MTKRGTGIGFVAIAGFLYAARFTRDLLLAVAIMVFASSCLSDRSEDWAKTFPVQMADLTSSGKGHYFILEPGNQLTLEGGKTRLVVTVLNETKVVDGVDTRIVEERESNNGQLVEVSRNFFALSKSDGSIYYFGEDVDIYKYGKVVNHEGAWQSGVNGAKFGMLIPGKPKVGMKFYQEVAPKVAMDRAEVVSISANVKTPAGAYKNCLKTEETTPLEPGAKEYKVYALGVGLVQDGDLKLTSIGQSRK